MRFYLNQLKKTPMILILLFTILFFGLQAIGENAEINRYLVVTAIGIDKIEQEDYEVSFLAFVPIAQQSFAERYKVITAKGVSLAEAMDFAGLQVGREVGLSHLKLIVLNKDLLYDDVENYLDYLTRNKHVSSSTKLITCNTSAKEFLDEAQKLDSESSVKVSDLISFNLKHVYAADSSLEIFFKGSYGPSRVGVISNLTVKEEQPSQSSATTDSQQQMMDSSQPKKEIVNNGDTAIFKDNRVKLFVSADEMMNLNMLNGKCTICSLQIKDFSDKDFDDCDLTFEIFDKKLSYKIKYENNVPVIYIESKLSLKLSEVAKGEGAREENLEFFVISPEAVKEIESKVKQMMADGLEIMRENQLDVANFYTLLFNHNQKKFKEFLDSLEDKDDYLNKIVFKASVDVSAK